MRRRPPKKGSQKEVPTNTLLVDGNALFKTGFFGAKNVYNHEGTHIGGLYQFITVLRKLLTENLYHNVYVFWDGNFSGKLRYNLYEDYKSGRGKDFINGTKPEDEDEVIQRFKATQYLEELFIRQIKHEIVESDDFIGYYCKNKKNYENITICTNDRDMVQLISEKVRIYFCDQTMKVYVNDSNFNQYFNYHLDNAALVKSIIGDQSDSIRGIKGVKETTLLTNIPELSTRKISLEEVINIAVKRQEERINNKKKPLKALTNIIEGITTNKDGLPVTKGIGFYELNWKLVNLSEPMMTNDACDEIDFLMESTLNPDGRSIKNAYVYMKRDGIDKLLGEHRYNDFLMPFKKLMERELKINLNNKL